MKILEDMPVNKTICDNMIRAYSIINNNKYKNIVCSISGGSDSDIMLDICHKVDIDNKIKYIFFDTGLEYNATKEHLKYLEDKYNIKIYHFKPKKPLPLIVKEYGLPFLNKLASDYLSRLQKHNFKFEDEDFDSLIMKYPKCRTALEWWCGGTGLYGIKRNKYLREYLIENSPKFKISDKCCFYCKKQVSHDAYKEFNADLAVIGVRKAEGGG